MSIFQLVPICRFTERTVRSGCVIAWRLATSPTSTSPDFVNATIDGVVRPPSAFGITVGSPASRNATTEFVVPRSIPTAFGISNPPLFEFFRCEEYNEVECLVVKSVVLEPPKLVKGSISRPRVRQLPTAHVIPKRPHPHQLDLDELDRAWFRLGDPPASGDEGNPLATGFCAATPHRPDDGRRAGVPGLFQQLTFGCLEGCLTGVDDAAGELAQYLTRSVAELAHKDHVAAAPRFDQM